MIRLLTRVAPLVLVSVPAWAQPANLQPTRDVTVTYRMNTPATAGAVSAPQEMRMAFSATAGKQRTDLPGGMGWMLVDRKANTAVMVMDEQKSTMAMPPATVEAMTQGVPPGATFTQKGTATVAGTACTEWDVAAGPGQGTSCITDDGVLLRAVATPPGGAPMTVMEATKVTYGPVDPALLSVPSGYAALSAPGGNAGVSNTVPAR